MIPTMLLLAWPSVGGRGSPSVCWPIRAVVASGNMRVTGWDCCQRVTAIPPEVSIERVSTQCGVMAAPFTVRSAVMVVYELFMTLARPKGELTRMPFGRHDRGTDLERTLKRCSVTFRRTRATPDRRR